jgi:ankyrin repeat protein
MFGVNHVFHAVPKTCPIIRDCLLPHVSELYQAIWMCSTDEVERLLSIGSDPSEERPNGKSPLFWAISLNDLSSIRLLLASGADPNHIEHFNWTPLTTALVTARGDIIQFLLHSGADPNKRTRAGVPPILYAGIAGQHADDPLWAIKALIHYGADPCAGDANGHTALHDVGNPQFVEFFLRQGCDVNATTANGRTPLHEAARASMTEGAQVLLAAGANPNAQDDAGTTPLHIAVYEIIDTEYVGFCQLLLDRGADIDCPDGAGRTPRMLMKELEQVASECDPEVLEFFHKYIQV